MDLIETLPPPWRLALAYAPVDMREKWLTLLALDVRLGGVVRSAREPVLAQMRLAWWRDRLRDDAGHWPKGEPLLAALGVWRGEHGALIGLVDGWEAMLGEEPDPVPLGEGRAMACNGIAPGGEAMARVWGLADGGARVDGAAAVRLPRALRPLVVLHGMAVRQNNQKISMFTLMRLGLLGF
jgi:phytoene synthase